MGPERMLSALGLGGFLGRGVWLKYGSADWRVCAGSAHRLLIDSSLPARSAYAARSVAVCPSPLGEFLAPLLPKCGEASAAVGAERGPPYQKGKHGPKAES